MAPQISDMPVQDALGLPQGSYAVMARQQLSGLLAMRLPSAVIAYRNVSLNISRANQIGRHAAAGDGDSRILSMA